jgi:peptidyl-prolyl cis-trans isomerase B (cyclophilin B)
MPQRRYGLIGFVVGLTLAVIVLCTAVGVLVWNVAKLTTAAPRPASSATQAAPDPVRPASETCVYVEQGVRAEPAHAVGTPSGTDLLAPGTLRFETNRGVIEVRTDAEHAPCTVNSLAYLVGKGYYDGTICHRLTTEGIFVLQCGDPKGNGMGGPGFQFADENLPSEPNDGYPAGTVAMANFGPGTNGSQFFFVYGDGRLGPNYTIIGKLTPASLAVVKKIAASGTDTGESDGRPKNPVMIKSAITR